MTTFDFTPLFRSSVGFDHMTRLLDAATRMDDGASSYPPYNIEKTGDNSYRITMAVAGFGENDLSVTAKENTLVIAGKLAKPEEEKKFLYRGIAGRAFERRFELAEFIKVDSANIENGLLHVDLVREVPETAKPRRIEVKAAAKPTAIGTKAA